MSRIVNGYTSLGSPTIDGVWSTDETTGAAPLPPAAPGAYNDDLDFTGVSDGTYAYTYTVTDGDCEDAKVLSIVVGTQTAPPNDNCAGAIPLLFPYGGGHFTLTNQYNSSVCPGYSSPTAGFVAVPGNWGAGTFIGDVWFKVSYNPANNPVGGTPIVAGISVSTIGIDTDIAMQYPLIAVYSDCAGTLVQAEVPGTSTEVTTVLSDVFATSFTYYVRVSCSTGNEGYFNLEITV